MDEKKRALELQEDFNNEFDRTLELLMDTYPRVSRVKKDKDLTKKMGQELNKTVVENFTWEVTTKKILSDMGIYKK